MNTDFDLDILPVKEDGTEQKLPRPLHPHLPNIASGQVGILISPVKTGKSTIISNLLLNENFYKDCFDMMKSFKTLLIIRIVFHEEKSHLLPLCWMTFLELRNRAKSII